MFESSTTFLRLKTQLDCLPILLNDVDVGALDRKPIPDKWSARENLAHLARYQQLFLERLHRILTEAAPQLPRYSAEQDSEWPRWAQMQVDEALTTLRTTRSELIKRVERLAETDLARTAAHPRFGTLTLVQWLEFFLLHEAHHLLAVIQRVREWISVPSSGTCSGFHRFNIYAGRLRVKLIVSRAYCWGFTFRTRRLYGRMPRTKAVRS